MRKIILKHALMALYSVVVLTALAACSDFPPIEPLTPAQQLELQQEGVIG
jgi:hypothetical protein